MDLTIWDVQHGSAAYLRTPTGRHLVFDLGVGALRGNTASFSPLLTLRRSGVQRLDEVIVTHPHRDHLDDVFNFDTLNPHVLRRPRHLREADIRAGNRPEDTEIVDKYLEIDRRYSEPIRDAENPESLVNAGMQLAFFHPRACATTNLNNHSIVTFLRYADSTVCLPGDNEAPSWRELLEQEGFQKWLRSTDILVASHHGREAGYCEEVFTYCAPVLVVASDGPSVDSSAVSRYSANARGWLVRSRSTGRGEQRKVVTTRSDGTVQVSAGFNADGRPFLAASVE